MQLEEPGLECRAGSEAPKSLVSHLKEAISWGDRSIKCLPGSPLSIPSVPREAAFRLQTLDEGVPAFPGRPPLRAAPLPTRTSYLSLICFFLSLEGRVVGHTGRALVRAVSVPASFCPSAPHQPALQKAPLQFSFVFNSQLISRSKKMEMPPGSPLVTLTRHPHWLQVRDSPSVADRSPGQDLALDSSLCNWARDSSGGGGGGQRHWDPASAPSSEPSGSRTRTVNSSGVISWAQALVA